MPAPEEPAAKATTRAVVLASTDLDAAALCAAVRALVHGEEVRVVSCDVGALTAPDLHAVDVLARLQLTARRAGATIELRDATDALRGLLVLSGLEEVLPPETPQSSGSD